MTESPKHFLSISSTDTPPSVTLTFDIDGKRQMVSLSPSDAVLAGHKLLSEAMSLLPDSQQFAVHPETQQQPSPPAPARPFPVPTPPRDAQQIQGDAGDAEEHRSDAPILVPPEYESLIRDEVQRDWRVTHSARTRGEQIGVSPEEMIETASFPDCVERRDSTTYAHVRGRISVLIPDADPEAIIGVTLVTRAFSGGKAQPAAPGRGPSGGPGRKMPDGFHDIRKMLLSHGFEIDEHRSGHPRIRHPQHPGVFVTIAGSPSDYRAHQNMIARVRREFGVDITQRP